MLCKQTAYTSVFVMKNRVLCACHSPDTPLIFLALKPSTLNPNTLKPNTLLNPKTLKTLAAAPPPPLPFTATWFAASRAMVLATSGGGGVPRRRDSGDGS